MTLEQFIMVFVIVWFCIAIVVLEDKRWKWGEKLNDDLEKKHQEEHDAYKEEFIKKFEDLY